MEEIYSNVAIIQLVEKETVLNNMLENQDANICIDEDLVKTYLDSPISEGKKISDLVDEAEKSLVRAVSCVSQCQVSLSAIEKENPCAKKILSIISNLKSVKLNIGKLLGTLSNFVLLFL